MFGLTDTEQNKQHTKVSFMDKADNSLMYLSDTKTNNPGNRF